MKTYFKILFCRVVVFLCCENGIKKAKFFFTESFTVVGTQQSPKN